MNFFVVDLHETASHQISGFGFTVHYRDNLVKSSRDDAPQLFVFSFAHHGVCFSTACLPICKNSPIVTF